MWIKTKDKMLDAVSVTVSKNYGSRKCKFVLLVLPSVGGLISPGQIVAGFMTKEDAELELNNICSAIECGDKVYRIADELCASLPRMM